MRLPELLITARDDGVPDPTMEAPVQVWQDEYGMSCAFGYRFGTQYWLHFPGLAHFKFWRHESHVIGIPEKDADLETITDTFFRSVTPLVLQVRGSEALHASAINSPSGVVAFCAVSGTGKSTLAFALSQRGYGHWADDAVIFRFENRRACSIPIPFTCRLLAPAISHFGISPEHRNPSPPIPTGGTSPVPLVGICILQRSEPDTAPSPIRVERLRASLALSELLQHAYCFSLDDPERKQATLRDYLDLVARVPIYRLTFVPNLNDLPRVQDEVETLFRAV